MIQDGKDYVIDDVRYPNEKKLIDRLGGDCWYIVRPQINNISNHESETSLTFHHCWNKIIINNNDKESLEKQWDFLFKITRIMSRNERNIFKLSLNEVYLLILVIY